MSGRRLMRVVNHEEHDVEKGDEKWREHIVTFDEPVTARRFFGWVESMTFFGYSPLKYGGRVYLITSEGELTREFDRRSEIAVSWAYAHRIDE